MSQNQSYFWQTTRHNVYLKRSAKLQMLLALLAVLTFSTVCIADFQNDGIDDNGDIKMLPTVRSADEKLLAQPDTFDVSNNQPESDASKEPKNQAGFIDAFTASLSVILFTELGDKTFFIAAIMAMRHPRLIVFTGAISALALMTVLSVVFGMAATIIPKVYTYYISTALFAIFGLKMIYEGYFMKDSDAQEELEEVQSDLRKREDELMRSSSKRSKYDDADAKRKNSNSDKEDVESGAGAAINSKSTANCNTTAALKNPEMQQHRQRKQLNNNNNNNKTGCESDVECDESDVFLNKGKEEKLKMSTFISSPALSAASNQTNQTNCDEFTNSPNKLNYKNAISNGNADVEQKMPLNKLNNAEDINETALIHSASANGKFNDGGNGNAPLAHITSSNSINSISSISLNSAAAAGQPNGELKQIGGSKKRLERDVSASLIQDPESGVVRKNSKKGAAYLTTRVLMQAFTMTFLAEWGDRSQLTTIILAASKDYYGVIAGGIIGHSICTGLAVVGGRMVAAKISVRTVTIVGGIVFLGFALYALIMRPDDI